MVMSPKPESPSTSHLCSMLQEALQESMHLPGPQLIHFLKYLFTEHYRWIKENNSQDLFSKNLGIDVLLQDGSEGRLASTGFTESESIEPEAVPGGVVYRTAAFVPRL